jgi:hypothetical protein
LKKFAGIVSFAVLLTWAPQAGGQSLQTDIEHSSMAALARAREVMGFTRVDNRVLHLRSIAADEQNYQSDRTYPPFFSSLSDQETWFDPASGVLRVQSNTVYPGSGSLPASVTLDDGRNAETVRGERTLALSRRQATGRALNAWAVIADWSAANDVRVAGAEVYRDYPRLVLVRGTAGGEQRLYLDPKSGFPVKLDYLEPHYLWGQRHVEYVWSTWVMKDGILFPGSAFRLADGDVELSQTISDTELVSREASPSLSVPQAPAKPPADLPLFLQAIAPQTVTISPNLHLLANPGYTEAIAMVNGEIYVFDATQSEDRARQDKERIEQLFPGRHPVNVVVTDLAWPHIAGVRYWVSQGATIMGHASARAFLQKVVDRHWTLAPDSLELMRRKSPARASMKFVSVDRAKNIASSGVRLIPIDGIGSEIALMAYLPAEKFLWASDYIQTLNEPSLYAREVLLAAKRSGIEPERVAAEHLPLSEWKAVQAAQKKQPTAAGAQ